MTLSVAERCGHCMICTSTVPLLGMDPPARVGVAGQAPLDPLEPIPRQGR